jgi:NADPH:quinone reductase-like Zn-dependent oxidoreductase
MIPGGAVKAWQLQQSGLKTAEIPKPTPGPDEVLVHVHAAGVTPTELSWYPTTHTNAGEKRMLAVPGHEFSGTIASGDSTGEKIYGMNDWFADGATAEYCITKPEWIAPKPRGLTHVQAASVPIGALTAWQGLFDRAELQSGETVLIHGGSGAVGVFAIQLAARQGAKVITTASERNKEFLLKLGANQVIDYHTESFEKIVGGIDVVFDAVGGKTLQKSWGVLSPTGRLVTIAADSEATSDDRTKAAFFIVEPNRDQLIKITNLLETGEIQPVVDASVPFDQADIAYADRVKSWSGRGKVVITVGT